MYGRLKLWTWRNGTNSSSTTSASSTVVYTREPRPPMPGNFSIQCGLCSGDGLSEKSPFKTESQLATNPYGIDTIYILIQSPKNE